MRLSIWLVASIVLCALLSACGDPQESTPENSPIEEISAADQTAIAEREVINKKFVSAGVPTIDPRYLPSELTSTGAVVVQTVVARQTPLPFSTPSPPSCGPMSGPNSRQSIVERYGELRTNCSPFGEVKYVATAGTDTQPGVLAILVCPKDDIACIRGDDPLTDLEWEIFPGPKGGPVKVIGGGEETGTLIVNNNGAQCRFLLSSYEYECP